MEDGLGTKYPLQARLRLTSSMRNVAIERCVVLVEATRGNNMRVTAVRSIECASLSFQLV